MTITAAESYVTGNIFLPADNAGPNCQFWGA